MEPSLDEQGTPEDARPGGPPGLTFRMVDESEAEEGPARPTALTADEVYFPRQYARFVSLLAQAVQKHSMYPPAHPALRPAVAAARQALQELLEGRFEIAMEVARNQVAIDGAESDPRNPQFRSLAGLLHRHQLAVVTFFVGVKDRELGEFLSAVAREPERVGRTLADDAQAGEVEWSNIHLHGIRYGALGISRGEAREGPHDSEAATRLWLGLARAALAVDRGGDDAADGGGGGTGEEVDRRRPTERPSGAELDPELMAAAIERRATEHEFATEMVGRLAALSKALRGGGADAELRGCASRFVSHIPPEALHHLLSLGGDAAARRDLVQSAAGWLDPASMVKLVRAAAGVERKDLSHTCLLLMMKLARYAGTDRAELGSEAEQRLRAQIDELVSEWTVADAIPDQYGEALERMSSSATARHDEARPRSTVEPERVLQMSIELDRPGARLAAAVSEMLEEGDFTALFETLDGAPPNGATAEAVWESLESADTIRRILSFPQPAFEALDRVLARTGPEVAPPMLEALIASDSRTVRRLLFERIGRMGGAAASHIVRHMSDERWYVRRNMLALLQTLEQVPGRWSSRDYARDPHPAVRREALKMCLHDSRQRGWAMRQLLEQDDARAVALGLGAALEDPPSEIIPNLLDFMGDEERSDELRCMAVRALAQLRTPESLVALQELVIEKPSRLRRLLRLRKLASASPVMLDALVALARSWWHDPQVQPILALAERSSDPDVRRAARGRMAS